MARTQQNVDASVTITLNGKEAEDQIKKLETKAEGLSKRLSEARKALNPDQAQIKKLESQLNSVNKTLKTVTDQTKKYESVLKNLDSSTLSKLKDAQKQLEREIRKLVPDTEAYIQATRNYSKVTSRIRSLENEYKKLGYQIKLTTDKNENFISRIAAGFQKYFAMMTTGIAIFIRLKNRTSEYVSAAAELDDIYSDVMKTTGLLREEVVALDEELKKMDTRTSREALLGLARDAGKLGITGTQNVLSFVEAADKINVALGEDLGEGAIRDLGKISDVFGLTDLLGIGDALTKVGSAINAVGQASTANEAYLVNFTQRLAGVMAQAKISAADTIGFASAFDQSGMAVEMASTALQQFITKMFTDTATFAKYAKMEVQDFTDLLNNDANKAIITVLQSLHETESLSELIGMFGDMGADGVRAVSALSSVAKNIDAVTEAQRISNIEFEKGTSLQQEFDTKNNNLQAQLEKSKKELHNVSVTIGQSLAPMLLAGTKAATALLKVFTSYGKELVITTATVGALALAVKIHNAQVKISTVLHATWGTTVGVLKAAFYLLTGQITKATAQMAAMNTVMKMSVWGLIAAGIVAATVAISNWIKKSREARISSEELSEAQKKVNEANKNADERYKSEAENVRFLSELIKDNSISVDRRRKAIEELQGIIPGYHAKLTDEGILIQNNTKAIEEYLQRLEDQIRLEELIKQKASFQGDMEKIKQASEEANAAWQEQYEQMRQQSMEMFGDFDPSRAMMMPFDDSQFVQQTTEIMDAMSAIDSQIESIKARWTSSEANPADAIVPDAATFKDALARLESQQEQELNVIKQSYIDKEISQAEYNEAIEDSNLEFLKRKIALARQYGEDETKYQAAYLDAEIKQLQKADAEMKKLQEESTKRLDEENKKRLANQRKTFDDTIKMAQSYLKELVSPIDEFHKVEDELLYLYEKGLLNDEQYQKALAEQRKKYAKKAIDATANIEEKGILKQYSAEKSALQQLLKEEMLTREEFEKEMIKLRVKYATQAMEQISTVLNAAGQLVSSMRDAEMASAEAQYQADLTAAGDNAEEKERIEAEYEQKQLDIKKKYADVDMGISIAKAIAEGALAVVRCWSDLGPVAGPVMAAIVAATTAAQIATIIAQRNAIMATSVSSSGSGSSSGTTSGQRTVVGMKDGGFAGSDPSDNTPMGIYHANEYVAPAWMVRREPILFRNMEQYRTSGHRPKSFTSGMKEGGYATSPTATPMSGDFDTKALNETLAKVNATMEKMMAEGVQSFMVYDQFKDFTDTRNRFKKITSRK